jgi:hypothetical protein
VSQAHENAGMHHISIRLRSHKIKGTRHLILVTTKIGHQMDIIDLEDETRDTKILTL